MIFKTGQNDNLSVTDISWFKNCRKFSDKKVFIYKEEKSEVNFLTGKMLINKVEILGSYLQSLTTAQQTVMILLPQGLEYVYSLVACLYDNLIAVPVNVAGTLQKEAAIEKINLILNDSKPSIIITNAYFKEFIKAEDYAGDVNIIDINELVENEIYIKEARTCEPSDMAILLYTSGSTSKPKGVMITHENLIYRVKFASYQWGIDENSVNVSWMPVFHTFGLEFGVLTPLLNGSTSIIVSPNSFLKDPKEWLKLIYNYKATHIAAPNFAFDYVCSTVNVEDINGVSLSSLKAIICGGELVHKDTYGRFIKMFKSAGLDKDAFCPHYGMSEIGTIVTKKLGQSTRDISVDIESLQLGKIKHINSDKNARNIVSCGEISKNIKVMIINTESLKPSLPGEIGEIWVKSLSLSPGYLNKEDETKTSFFATIADTKESGFFRTGDLGYIEENNLYVIGRKKEVMVIHGKNHYPIDIESTIKKSIPTISLPGVTFSCEINNQERVVVVQEVHKKYTDKLEYRNIIRNIISSVSANHGIEVYEVYLVCEGGIPKTSTGKIQRNLCRKDYLDKKLSAIFQYPEKGADSSILNQDDSVKPGDLILEKIKKEVLFSILNIDPARLKNITLISELGLDSIKYIQISNQIEKVFKIQFSPAKLFEYQDIEKLALYISDNVKDSKSKSKSTYQAQLREDFKKNDKMCEGDIAIIGMSCQFPGGAINLESYWENLIGQKDCITSISESRPEILNHYRHCYANLDNPFPQWGGFIDDFDKFDAAFFGISPLEAESMDPQQRKLLEITWSVIEDSGYNPIEMKGKDIGLFVGIHNVDYGELVSINANLIEIYGAYLDSGIHMSMIPNRVSRWFDFHGPSEVINTACSSSLVAVHHAVESIHRGECSLSIAAGANLLLSSRIYRTSYKAGMLSSDGHCKTFDNEAGGFVRSEGLGAVLLKPYAQAVKDGDPIYGVIKNAVINHDGHSNSLRAPNLNAQKQLIKDAYSKPGLNPETISYIEAHGTGTPIGDPIEISALCEAFKELNSNLNVGYCAVGSAKTCIGHCESASGIAGLIKVILSMKHEMLPGILHFKKLNSYIDLKDSPFYIVDHNTKWKRIKDAQGREIPRRAGISAFGFGGVNAHVVLDEYIDENAIQCKVNKGTEERKVIIPISAKNKESLKKSVQQLLNYLNRYLDNEGNINKCFEYIDLSQVAYTLQIGRSDMEERIAFLAKDITEVIKKMNKFVKGDKNIEDFWSGKVNSIGENTQLIYSDKDVHSTVSEWIDNSNFNKIAEYWVNGGTVYWKLLYKNEIPKRMHLPTYPFAKDRYWMSEENDKLDYPINYNMRSYIHPLVHENTSDLYEQRFSSIFTGEESLLKNHMINGKKVLPGVACLEMAREALYLALDVSKMSQAITTCLKNVVWIRPIKVEDKPLHINIRIKSTGSEKLKYEIYDENVNGQKEDLIYSEGIAELSTVVKIPVINLEEAKAKCNKSLVTPEECYNAFRKAGINYGSTHQGITSIYVGEGKALAKISLTSKDINEFIVYPAVVDSALQSLIALRDIASFKLEIPYAADSVCIFRRCTSSMWSYSEYSKDNVSGGNYQKFDIRLCDEQGNVCIFIKGLSLRSVDRVFENTKERNKKWSMLIFNPFWKESLVRDGIINKLNYDRKVVFLCEPVGITKENIEDQMTGVKCIELKSDDDNIGKRYRSYTIKIIDEIRSIFISKPKKSVLVQLVVCSEKQGLFTGLLGIFKTAHLENPMLVGQVIEIDTWKKSKGIVKKLGESSIYPENNFVKYIEGKRYIMEWEQSQGELEKKSIPWKDEGVYLITGGFGGLGLIFAKEIAEKVRNPIIVLIGRSSLSKSKQDKIIEIGKLGAEILYEQIDVGNKTEVENLIKSVKDRFKCINGIIHSAGIIHDNFIIKKTETEIKEVLTPKVDGILNIDEASKDLKLDFIILFSSISGSMGNVGQADYSSANAFLDAYANYRNKLVLKNERYGQTLSIDWSLWKDGGMKVCDENQIALNNKGIIGIVKEEGIAAFYQCFLLGKNQMLVIKGDRDLLKKAFLKQQINRETVNLELYDKNIKSLEVEENYVYNVAVKYLKNVVSVVTKLPIIDIDEDAPMERYGIDSILVVRLTEELEKVFGPLPKTLFFEYGSIRLLSNYFVEVHRKRLIELIGVNKKEYFSSTSKSNIENEMNKINCGSNSRFAKRYMEISDDKQVNDDDIAIIGISGRYPGAENIDEFWKVLKNGKDCITEIPKNRWDYTKYFDEEKNRPGKTYSKWGGFIENVDCFDPLFFNISPKEAERMDPQERLFLECAYGAMEDAGYIRKSFDNEVYGDVGVFVGVMFEEYQLYGAQQTVLGKTSALSGNPSSIANRVSYFCNFHGPSIAIDTMCSSSLTALHLACKSLQRGECKLAISGGVNLSIHPNKYLLLAQGRFASSKGRCESFGEGGDGYVPGEGVGAVILKPLSKAVEDGDHIYGIVKSTAINHGGKTNGYTVPNPNAQADVIEQTFKNSGINPRVVSYIEAHGTGTSLGDPIEITGLNKVFKKYTNDKQFCAIGSVKSNIGHCESAAGIASLTKVILQMKYGKLVPSIHSKVLNPNIDFKNTPFVVQQDLKEWKRPVVEINGIKKEYPRIAGISAFGAGGSNAHMIIEEYIHEPIYKVNETVIIVLSAKREDQLRDRAIQLQAWIKDNRENSSLVDVAYTLQVGREAMDERLGIIASSFEEVEEKLEKYVRKEEMEDIYQNRIAHKKDELILMLNDDDMEKTISAWINKKKYSKIIQLWVNGYNLDWNKLYDNVRPRKVSLPAYPFAKEHYWAPDTELLNGTGKSSLNDVGTENYVASSKQEMIEVMTFEETCEKQEIYDMGDAQVKTLICFLSRKENQEMFIENLRNLGFSTKVIFISQGIEYNKISQQLYSMPKRKQGYYEKIFQNIKSDFGHIDSIIYLWPFEEAECIKDVSPIVYIVQSIDKANLKPKRFLVGAEYRNELDRCFIESWIGFERSLRFVFLEMDMAIVFEKENKNRAGELIQKVCDELRSNKVESVLYKDGKRHVFRIKHNKMDLGNNVLKKQGTYLITGGLGCIGFVFARYLAKKYAANLVLVGRSPMDKEKRSKIKKLEDIGGQVLYLQADICNVDLMRTVIKKAKEHFNKIDGVIHAAGIVSNESLLKKSIEDFQAVLNPKIKGTLVLSELFKEEETEFICYFSSTSAILGDFGFCDYAVANRFLNAHARFFNNCHNKSKVIAIDWPLWRNGGMGFEEMDSTEMYLKSTGQRLLENEEGTEVFEHILKDGNTQYMVLAGQPMRIQKFLEKNNEKIVSSAYNDTKFSKKKERQSMRGLSIEQRIEWDLKEHISKLLKIPKDKLDNDENLADFGFDSVLLSDFALVLADYYDIKITPSIFFGYSTIKKLVNYFMKEYKETIEKFYGKFDIQQYSAEKETVNEKIYKHESYHKTNDNQSNLYDNGVEPIAIIGLSGRFPKARNVAEMWQIIKQGQDVVDEIPLERWDWRKYYGDTTKDSRKTNSKWCGCIQGVSEFDPKFFKITPLEAKYMDPRQRLLLQESWNALEDAGYGASQISDSKISMFVGVEQGDYQELVKEDGTITSNNDAILAARLSYFLNLNGPNMAINTACSSGLVAVHQACASLRNDECDTAIASSANLILTPERFVRMSQAGMLSPDGKCFAFDKRANGMVPGEAIVAVVLKKLSKAKLDGDPIYAVIRGSSINYDGKTNGITAPSGTAQVDLIKTVYDKYKISPEEITYIITHGTGTKLGDSIEINALHEAFKQYTSNKKYCAITSNKTNFGHTFAASGLVSLVTMVQAMRHEAIPASLHCEYESDYINWEGSPFYVNKTYKPWNKYKDKCLTGAISAFGMSGTNVHMIIQSYQDNKIKNLDQVPYYLLTFSAKTLAALHEKINDMYTALKNNELKNQNLLQVSYTLLEGRHHFNYRCAIVVQNWEDVEYALTNMVKNIKIPNSFYGDVSKDFISQKLTQHYVHDLVEQSQLNRKNSNEYKEIIFALADLYCQGYEIPCRQLYNIKDIDKVHLPTYPFTREKYWITDKNNIKKEENSKVSVKDEITLKSHNDISSKDKKAEMDFKGEEGFKVKKIDDDSIPQSELAKNTVKLIELSPVENVFTQCESANESEAAQKNSDIKLEKSIEEELVLSLSKALYLNPDEIEENTSFIDLGIDSIIGVQWIDGINEKYGTSISATKIYDYSNIHEFSNFLAKTLDGLGKTNKCVKDIKNINRTEGIVLRPLNEGMSSQDKVSVKIIESNVLEHNDSLELEPKEKVINTQDSSYTDILKDELAKSLAEVLCMTIEEIDENAKFIEMGIDSIICVQWIERVNKKYNTSIPATKIYDYPTFHEFTVFLEMEIGKLKGKIDLQDEGYHLDEIIQQVEHGNMDVDQAYTLLQKSIIIK